MEIREFKESDRDGKWKSYDYHVFRQRFQEVPPLATSANVEWLSPEDIADPNRRPVSKTCREVVARAKAHCSDLGMAFP